MGQREGRRDDKAAMTLIYAIVLLGILIFVHELGHFLAAKLLGVKVLKFSLGFGSKIAGFTRGETEYRISAIPLGGYVKMLGEEPGEELPEEDKKRAFNNQSVWRRFLIVLSGPLFNLVFAAFLFILMFGIGVPALHPEVGETLDDSPAQKSGIVKGDRITEIEGRKIAEWSEMTDVIYKNPGNPLNIKIKREGKTIELLITPEKKTVQNIFGEDKDIGLIGIKPSGSHFTKTHSLPAALYLGTKRTVDITVLTVVSIVKLIQRVIPLNTIGGPIMILQMAGDQASQGAFNFITFTAFISINLGVINLVPIPILDGGHILFLSIEAVRKRPLREKTMILAQKAGLAALLMLMAFALYNDLLRVFFPSAQ